MTLVKGFETEQELLDEIGLTFPTQDWDDDKRRDFLYQLIGIGITTAEHFRERFAYTTQDPKPYTDFVWFYYWDLKDLGDELLALHGICIDYQRTWECYLSNRYQCFTFDDHVHFYRMAHLSEH